MFQSNAIQCFPLYSPVPMFLAAATARWAVEEIQAVSYPGSRRVSKAVLLHGY